MKQLLLMIVLFLPSFCFAKPPACASWPINITEVQFKNDGVTDPTKLDETRTKATLLAAEKLGPDLYKEIYDIVFFEKTGKRFEVITSNEASSEECSMSDVDIYVVSPREAP